MGQQRGCTIAWFPSWQTTGASPRATGGCILPCVRHSTLTCNRLPRPADMPSPMSTPGSAPLPTPTNLFFPLHARARAHTARRAAASEVDSAHRPTLLLHDPTKHALVGVAHPLHLRRMHKRVSKRCDFSTRGARTTRPGERPPARWTARTVPLSISSPPMAASLVRTCQDAHKRAP